MKVVDAPAAAAAAALATGTQQQQHQRQWRPPLRAHTQACRLSWTLINTLVISILISGVGSECNNPQELTATGSWKHLQSDNYPEPYDNDLDVCWRITASSSDHMVYVEFLDSELDTSVACSSADFIEIKNGGDWSSPILGRVCGQQSPSVVSSGRYLYLRFVTDSVYTFRGFHLQYRSLATGELSTLSSQVMGVTPDWAEDSGCENTLYLKSKSSQQELTSTNYPITYSSNTDTCWQIYAGRGEDKVDIKFTHLDLEDSDPCRDHDHVEIRDGSHEWSVKEVDACGSELPSDFRSSGAFVLVHFVTDSDTSRGAGFALKYSTFDELAAKRAATRDTYLGIGIAAAVILVVAIGCGLHRKFKGKNRVASPRETTRVAAAPPSMIVPPPANVRGAEPQHYRGESRRSFSYTAPQFPVYGPGYQSFGGHPAQFSMQPPPYSPRESPPAYSQIPEDQDAPKDDKEEEQPENEKKEGEKKEQEIEDIEETELRF